jgi:hypothetical protein
MTDVTIRGIDDGIYRRFSAEARNRGIAIGKLVTLAMSNLLEVKPMGNYKIENVEEEVIISKKDLESLDKPVILKNILKLTFIGDVDGPTFINCVERMENIEELKVPDTLTKLLILAKSKNVGKITQNNESR